MTALQQQIIACAKENGYKESKYIKHDVVHIQSVGEWWIRSGMDNPWVVTDEQFKQWQRDYKLKQIGINE